MIGAILGDIVGSRFEFHNRLSKDFRFLAYGCEFTDDTVMTCAVAQALMDSREDYADLSEKTVAAMQRIGRQYPNCGYGAKFIHWMFADDPQPYNSCGNGSAMRVSPVGFAARDVEEAKKLSAAVTCVSHDHPEGMKGAEATAVAIVMARQGKTKEEIQEAAGTLLTAMGATDLFQKIGELSEAAAPVAASPAVFDANQTFEEFTIVSFSQYADGEWVEIPFEPDEVILYVSDSALSDGTSVVMEVEGEQYRGIVTEGELLWIDPLPIMETEDVETYTEIEKMGENIELVLMVFTEDDWYTNEIMLAPVA